MGCLCSKQKEDDMKEGVEEVVHELPENLKQKQMAGSVTVGYDPTKTPEENAQNKAERKHVFHGKLADMARQKYPDQSVTMGDPFTELEADHPDPKCCADKNS